MTGTLEQWDDLAALYKMADHRAPGGDDGQESASTGLPAAGSAPDLLRKRDAELERWHFCHTFYRPGMALEPEAEPFREDFEQAWKLDAAGEARQQALRSEARRVLDAESWKEPGAGGSLADELMRPRETFLHRITGLAGWGHNVLIAGERKAGKSLLAANLSAALSLSSARQGPAGPAWTPGRFLGWLDCYLSGKVAFLSLEMDRDDFADMFRPMPPGSLDASRIHALHLRGLPFPVVTNHAARAWLVSWLRERQAEVLIVDTWGALCAVNGVRNLNDDGEVRPVLAALDQIKRESGVSCLIVLTHTPHQTGDPHLERFKGAGAVGDWADALWLYTRGSDGIRNLAAEGRARIAFPETGLGYDPASGVLWLAGGDRASRERAALRARITEAALREPGITTDKLCAVAGGHKNTTTAELDRMLAEGTAEDRAEGHRAPVVPGLDQPDPSLMAIRPTLYRSVGRPRPGAWPSLVEWSR